MASAGMGVRGCVAVATLCAVTAVVSGNHNAVGQTPLMGWSGCEFQPCPSEITSLEPLSCHTLIHCVWCTATAAPVCPNRTLGTPSPLDTDVPIRRLQQHWWESHPIRFFVCVCLTGVVCAHHRATFGTFSDSVHVRAMHAVVWRALPVCATDPWPFNLVHPCGRLMTGAARH